MEKRIQLRFNRNQEQYVTHYLVYRKNSPGVDTRSPLIMKVAQPLVVNPLPVVNAKAMRVDAKTYQLPYAYILSSKPVVVTVDGLENTDLFVDYLNGMVLFNEEINDTAEVLASFHFDGIEILDDDAPQEMVLEYYGPTALDTSSPNAPSNMSLSINPDQTEGTIQYEQTFSNGSTYYYRIEARSDTGDFSQLSNEISSVLEGGIDHYRIEYSRDNGVNWTLDGTSTGNWYLTRNLDKEPPEPLKGATAMITPIQNSGEADVDFTWMTPVENARLGLSPTFRVVAITEAGALSQPGLTVGPEQVKTPIEGIRIRKKLNDGTYPSYDGPDAVTVATLYDTTIGTYRDTVLSGEEYSYSLFVVDKAGNYSPATAFIIKVDNTTPPIAVQGVTVRIHNTIV